MMAMHENNKKEKKKKLYHRKVDCMFRSLTAGQNNYTYINTHIHACRARHTERRVILSDNVFSRAEASLDFWSCGRAALQPQAMIVTSLL